MFHVRGIDNNNENIFIFGWIDINGNYLNSIESLNIYTNTWILVNDSLHRSRSHAIASKDYHTNTIFIIGVSNNNETISSFSWIQKYNCTNQQIFDATGYIFLNHFNSTLIHFEHFWRMFIYLGVFLSPAISNFGYTKISNYESDDYAYDITLTVGGIDNNLNELNTIQFIPRDRTNETLPVSVQIIDNKYGQNISIDAYSRHVFPIQAEIGWNSIITPWYINWPRIELVTLNDGNLSYISKIESIPINNNPYYSNGLQFNFVSNFEEYNLTPDNSDLLYTVILTLSIKSLRQINKYCVDWGYFN